MHRPDFREIALCDTDVAVEEAPCEPRAERPVVVRAKSGNQDEFASYAVSSDLNPKRVMEMNVPMSPTSIVLRRP